MKAIIALSGLAGFALFGPGFLHSHDGAGRTPAVVEVHAITRVAHEVRADTRATARVARTLQSQCRYEDELSLTMPVGAGDALRLLAGSGSLEVTGVAGLREVRAVGRACASHEEFLEDLDLTGEMDGSELVVETHYPDFGGMRGWGSRYARIDLRLEVPEGMVADIRDSSGEIVIEGTGSLTIDDSSGEIELFGIDGSVWIEDSSGEIVVRDVTGDIEIEDGSGEIEITGVGGGVTIDDGSGEIDVQEVVGNVLVVRDGSGSIEVDGVGGDFTVERDGSGSIHYQDVQGRVDVPRRRR